MAFFAKVLKTVKTLISTTTARVYDIAVISGLIICGFITIYGKPYKTSVYKRKYSKTQNNHHKGPAN
jgi:hypothetical protein